jgi:hypothetical protein
MLAGVAMALAGCGAPVKGPPIAAAGTTHRHYHITPFEMLEVYGVYHLDNGDVLRITREHRRYWAELRSKGKIEIEPVGSIVFVTKDGGTRLEFSPQPFGTEVRLTALRGSSIEREFGE